MHSSEPGNGRERLQSAWNKETPNIVLCNGPNYIVKQVHLATKGPNPADQQQSNLECANRSSLCVFRTVVPQLQSQNRSTNELKSEYNQLQFISKLRNDTEFTDVRPLQPNPGNLQQNVLKTANSHDQNVLTCSSQLQLEHNPLNEPGYRSDQLQSVSSQSPRELETAPFPTQRHQTSAQLTYDTDLCNESDPCLTNTNSVNTHSLNLRPVPYLEEQSLTTDPFIQQNGCLVPIGKVLVENGTDVSTVSEIDGTSNLDYDLLANLQTSAQQTNDIEVCSESGLYLTNWDADKEQQIFKHTYELPDGKMVLIGIDEKDSSVHISTLSETDSTSNLKAELLWVNLAVPGESLKQFLRKNWSNMLRYLPVRRSKKSARFVWQEEEPKDPKELKRWFKAITEKYWTVMMGKTDEIPTNEEKGIIWQKIFMERCETVRPLPRGQPY